MKQPIIIFGAALKADGTPHLALIARVQVAVDYGKQCDDPLYIVTGGNPQSGKAEADVMVELLLSLGVSSNHIFIEDQAQKTIHSVFLCNNLLLQSGFKKKKDPIILVSSAYHLPRCCWLMFLLGWRIYTVKFPSIKASRSVGKRWRWRLREVPAIIWDSLRFLYFIYFRMR